MNWRNVRLILWREVRDQLRDRRTIFMIAVLPLLLYPLLGLSIFQIMQFVREHPLKVLVVGAPDLSGLPPLITETHFTPTLFTHPEKSRLLELSFDHELEGREADDSTLERARQLVRKGDYAAALYFPPRFGAELKQFRESLLNTEREPGLIDVSEIPSPLVISNQAQERSAEVAAPRIYEVLHHWTEAIVRQNLIDSHLPLATACPFEVQPDDVSSQESRKSVIWSKILPFVLLLWALTGAFYPAVDLCAGEKERGTLETLLSSPAERTEIVWGKLLTIILFSGATSVLNLISMGLTGMSAMSHFADLGTPPLAALCWLAVALVPMATLFSALCLAVAALARSTKEGQYYLMPLMLITLPLTLIPMSPAVELSWGTSLIPVTGVVLLLKMALEGNYWGALPYVPVVATVTLGCCLFAIRWAVDQFNSEQILFRESERLDLKHWFRQLVRNRQETPSVAMALFAGALLLALQYFVQLLIPPNISPLGLILIPQIGIMLIPTLVLSWLLTRSPRQTLQLRRPSPTAAGCAVLLALSLAPVMAQVRQAFEWLFPMSDEMVQQSQALSQILTSSWWCVAAAALTPAICEELAFRGFILSGLRHSGHKWRAIVVSSLFFGVAHVVLQQSFNAMVLGCIIAYLAVQTGSIVPGMLFHAMNNGLMLVLGWLFDEGCLDNDLARGFIETEPHLGFRFTHTALALGCLGTFYLLHWFARQQYQQTVEEKLVDDIARLEHDRIETEILRGQLVSDSQAVQ